MSESKKFAYIKNEIKTKDCVISKFSVGIIEAENTNFYTINFVVGNSLVDIAKSEVEIFNPLEVGDLFPFKVCNVCHKFLPTQNFSKNQNGKGDRTIRRPSCDGCRKIIDGKNLSSKDKREWEKSKPNLDIFICPICHKKTIPGLTSKVVLDHNHKTGKPRAWICDSCNTGIGRFKDEVELLKNAIKYLETN